MSIRCYSELIQLPTFLDRYQYLRLDGVVGEETFGFDRYMNQAFYKSPEWRRVRDAVIARDLGCDLGVAGREIFRRPIIHHMNPISPKDIRDRVEMILDPEYLITTIHETHLAIHYGDENLRFRSRSYEGPTTPASGKCRKEGRHSALLFRLAKS